MGLIEFSSNREPKSSLTLTASLDLNLRKQIGGDEFNKEREREGERGLTRWRRTGKCVKSWSGRRVNFLLLVSRSVCRSPLAVSVSASTDASRAQPERSSSWSRTTRYRRKTTLEFTISVTIGRRSPKGRATTSRNPRPFSEPFFFNSIETEEHSNKLV